MNSSQITEADDLLEEHVGEEKHINAGEYIKSAVYGGLDGLITTLSVALSGIGSGLAPGYILAFGLASLIGDAISMAVADYLATKSDDEYMKAEEVRERAEMEADYESEKLEMVHIYKEMGLEARVA